MDNLRLSAAGSVRLDEAVAGLGKPDRRRSGSSRSLGVFWAASGMMAAIRIALTTVWGPERRQAWRGKAFDLVLVLLAGVLLLVAFALTLVVRLVEDMGARVGSALGLEQLGSTAGDAAQAVASVGVSSSWCCSSTTTCPRRVRGSPSCGCRRFSWRSPWR